MNFTIYTSESRGYANHGWLQAKHSFSFGQYYNRERMNFGVLRVLNNDIIAPGEGFGTHPHDNMEIITIPLQGALAHKDSMGNASTITAGEIQVMSAGTGIYHSEFNASSDEPVELFQIWLFPHTQNVEPRYQQTSLFNLAKKNALYQILSPFEDSPGVWIHQNAWMYMGNFDEETSTEYRLHNKKNGVFCMSVYGSLEIAGQSLDERDAIAVWDTETMSIRAQKNAQVLLIEVPLS